MFIVCLLVALVAGFSASDASAQDRPKVGVALGGGSARGLAHVGVLRWLEEHHIPVDELSGTSMGGLVGGAYATGMTPDEIEAMLDEVDWDTMFGSSRFDFLNVRRKRDLRAYPSRLEFGLKGGIVPPPSLNSGQQVELFLSRIAAAYYDLPSFDQLPTPFRCVAVDLTQAKPIVLDRGSLAAAMRSTMSLPMVFPPVPSGSQVLVDGGAMNNIPADVVRAMGASKVIAVNVGDLGDRTKLDYSLIGLVMETLDAMMRANTLKGVEGADVRINVPVTGFGSLDWRRAKELIAEGYQAAESMRDQLLPLAVGDAEWQAHMARRAAAKRATFPAPAFVEVLGAVSSDTDRMTHALEPLTGQPFDLDRLEHLVTEMGGLDRYETLSWQLVPRDGQYGIVVTANPKSYGPPFVMLGISLENTTGNEFRFGLGGRYLAFDTIGSGSELRIDANIGSDPSLALALYKPIWTSRLFVEPFAGVGSETFSVIQDGHTAATYQRTRATLGADAGVSISRIDEARAGIRYGWTKASVGIGDPGLPELKGEDSLFTFRYTHDGQDSPVVPSRGAHYRAYLRHWLSAPALPPEAADFNPYLADRTTDGVTQFEIVGSWLKSLNRPRSHRVFLGGGLGTSFAGQPLPTEQFALGGPLRMSAFSVGEQRGDHYIYGAVGYLHQVFRLPDFLGGPVFGGTWFESGSAFDHARDAKVGYDFSVGVMAETLIGPVFGAVSVAVDGNTRFYIGIGQIFR